MKVGRPRAGLRVQTVGAARAVVDVEVKARAASGFNAAVKIGAGTFVQRDLQTK